MARILTVAAGLFGTISAVLISKMDPDSLWELILLLVGLFGSSLCGVFLLGVFTRRASARGVALGVAASIMSLIMLRTSIMSLVMRRTFHIPIHPFLTAAVGVLSCVAVGYVASIFLPNPDRLLKNLTLATLEDAKEEG